METLTNAVNTMTNTVANTVTSAIWSKDENKRPDQQQPAQPEQSEQSEQSEHAEHPAQPEQQQETQHLDPSISKDAATRERIPSVMGNTTEEERTHSSPNPVPELAHLSMRESPSTNNLDMQHDQDGYPYKDTITKEDTTGNAATAGVLIDAGGDIDRNLKDENEIEKKQDHHAHRRHDSGVQGMEHPATEGTGPRIGEKRPFEGSTAEGSTEREIQDRIANDQRKKHNYLPTFFPKFDEFNSLQESTRKSQQQQQESGEAATTDYSHESSAASHPSDPMSQHRSTKDQSQPYPQRQHQTSHVTPETSFHTMSVLDASRPTTATQHISPHATLGTQREGISSSNEPTSQGDPTNAATTNSIHTMGKGFTFSADGAMEPSFGGHVSGVQPIHEQQGAENPMEAPKEGDHEETQEQGPGEKIERTTGTAAEGGNFDAIKPGAGKEADRLLEESGVNRSVPGGIAGAQLNEGHKLGHMLHHRPDSKVAEGHTGGDKEGGGHEKMKIGKKIKEKLHIGHH